VEQTSLAGIGALPPKTPAARVLRVTIMGDLPRQRDEIE
jgi:hypothetical protein